MTPTVSPLPPWAEKMRELFVSGAASQFLLYGNVLDLVPTADADSRRAFLPLRRVCE